VISKLNWRERKRRRKEVGKAKKKRGEPAEPWGTP